MQALYRILSIISFWCASTLSHAVPVALDFSSYEDGTPIASISIPGVTFEVAPGTTAYVDKDRNGFWIYGAGTQARVTIRTSGAMTSSTFSTDGYGSCQTPLPGDIVKWYLGSNLIETNDNFVQYSGRCNARQFSRSFAHDSIVFEPHYDAQYGSQEMVVSNITLDFTPPVANTQAIPTLSEWGMIILSSLLAVFGLLDIRRRRM